jgi:hypothetical protein
LLIPLAVVAGIAVAVVLVLRAGPGRAERQLVTSYVHAWAAGDYHQMYTLLSPASQEAVSEARFARDYRRDATTATTVKLIPLRVGHRRGEFIAVVMGVSTRLFGSLRETLEVPLEGTGSSATVHFVPSLLFPGLAGHERLTRHMSLAPRATLFAADGTPLARGPDRT